MTVIPRPLPTRFSGNRGPGGLGRGPGGGGNRPPGRIPPSGTPVWTPKPAVAVPVAAAAARIPMPLQALALVGAFAVGYAIGTALLQVWGLMNPGPSKPGTPAAGPSGAWEVTGSFAVGRFRTSNDQFLGNFINNVRKILSVTEAGPFEGFYQDFYFTYETVYIDSQTLTQKTTTYALPAGGSEYAAARDITGTVVSERPVGEPSPPAWPPAEVVQPVAPAVAPIPEPSMPSSPVVLPLPEAVPITQPTPVTPSPAVPPPTAPARWTPRAPRLPPGAQQTQNGAVIPLPTEAPKPTPTDVHFPWAGGPGVGPGGTRPDIAAVAQEVGRIEQKLALMPRPGQDPGNPIDWGDIAATLLRIWEAIQATNAEGIYTLSSPCVLDEETDERIVTEVEYDGGLTWLEVLNNKVDALAQLQQVAKDLKQPICRHKAEGQPVTVTFTQQ